MIYFSSIFHFQEPVLVCWCLLKWSIGPFLHFCRTWDPSNFYKLQVWNSWFQFFHVWTYSSIWVTFETDEVCLCLLGDLALKQAVLVDTLLNWISFVQDWIFNVILNMKSDVLNLRCLHTACSKRLFLYTLVSFTLEHIDLWVDVQNRAFFKLVLSWFKLLFAGIFASFAAEFLHRPEHVAFLVWIVECIHSRICDYISFSTHLRRVDHIIWIPRVHLFTSWALAYAYRAVRLVMHLINGHSRKWMLL